MSWSRAMLLIAVALTMYIVWANRVITDADDQCGDSSMPVAARFLACTVEGR